ncbi:hypothetical protein MTR67_035028 [Solanum verrucosum]|uniref:Reverse transcriptase/retrotransposon-derived protein RNase H-like domain-containing protein n=1 Tax=Solanum verrucosum TaxID=315347 RepID=A0AAF0ZL28_SOLVR|nr:hypothetical protein MTR67_035028 [Solanum verrucosum]
MLGIQVNPKKSKAVKNWPKPLSALEIRSFLGLYSYYRRFVDGFSSIASNLTILTQKKVKFLLSGLCEKSFYELKDRLSSAPILTLLEGSDGFVVYCDASRIGQGCVLMQHELNLYQIRWLELLKDYDISFLYHPGKANLVEATLSRLLMGSVSLVEKYKELVRDVHRFAWLGVHLVYSNEGGVVIHNSSESSLY